MCGICGVVNNERDRPVGAEVLGRMTNTMVHRGPDDHGLYIDGPVGLGHRRLSIIDLETGRQPMSNEDETVWIVFNGEVYNCLELRDDLQARGHSFRTRSDTEVIVHAYEEYGTGCVKLLNGMFAFALWDAARSRLFAARDRVGIKPFYYAEINGAFLFGSELKSILAYPNVERQLDFVALNQYLAFEYVPTPRTIFEGISKLPPGHTITIEQGRTTIEPYWDVSLFESEASTGVSAGEYEARLKDVLLDSVRKELISDVPLGVLLSGGIDSSAVAAMMVELAPGNVRSFSIAFEDPSFDESRHAQLVAKHLGTEHHEATLTAQMMLDLVPRIAEFLDEPLGDSSIIPTYLLSHFTRQHVKVALGGDGGDELFAGYTTLQAHRIMEVFRRVVPKPLRRGLIPWLVDKLPVSFDNISFDFKARRFIAGQWAAPLERHHMWIGSFAAEQRRLLMAEQRHCDGDSGALLSSHLDACGAAELINQVLYCDIKLYLEGDILSKVDRASMANSLEVRVPLLNQVVLEFANSLPHRLKLHGLTTKYLLRRALKGRVPKSILQRGKKGFNIPVAKWLCGPLLPLATDMLNEDRLKRAGLFNPSYVKRLLDEHLTHRCDHRKLLWTLLVFELWREKWA